MTTLTATLESRGSRYGSFTSNAQTTQDLMTVLAKGINADTLRPEHWEAFHMICHKMARAVNGDCMYADNAHDIAGYATLLEDWINETNGQEAL